MLILGNKLFPKNKPDRSSAFISFWLVQPSECLQRGINLERISVFGPGETLKGLPQFRLFLKKSLPFEQQIKARAPRQWHPVAWPCTGLLNTSSLPGSTLWCWVTFLYWWRREKTINCIPRTFSTKEIGKLSTSLEDVSGMSGSQQHAVSASQPAGLSSPLPRARRSPRSPPPHSLDGAASHCCSPRAGIVCGLQLLRAKAHSVPSDRKSVV